MEGSILRVIHEYVEKGENRVSSFDRFPGRGNPIWITKEGRRIPVGEMTDGHIESCIQILDTKIKVNAKTRKWVEVFQQELEKRGRT